MRENNILKRICIFFLGLVIGLVAGHKYGVAEMKERVKNRMKQVDKSPEPRGETFFKKKNTRPNGGKRERTNR